MLVGVGGFEPPASRTRTVRSTRLSHTPMKMILIRDQTLKKTSSRGNYFSMKPRYKIKALMEGP